LAHPVYVNVDDDDESIELVLLTAIKQSQVC